MVSRSKNWGGKRKGAGRPQSVVVRLKDVTIPREVWQYFELAAAEQGVSVNDLIAEVLESYVKAPLFAKI